MSKNSALHFVKLDADKWPQFKEAILLSEQMFDESLRTEEKEYAEIVADPLSVSVVALMGQHYAGAAITKKLKSEDLEDLKLQDQILDSSGRYLHNFVVDVQWQGKGVGLAMMQHLIERLKDAQIKRLNGHFRPNGSLTTMLKLGGEIIKEEPNWFETGETYSYCELALS